MLFAGLLSMSGEATCYRPHVFDVAGFVWFCVCLLCACDCLHCHCHAESLACAVNVEIAAACILFDMLLHAVLLASILNAQCFSGIVCVCVCIYIYIYEGCTSDC